MKQSVTFPKAYMSGVVVDINDPFILSGRNNYLCTGCSNEVIACKGERNQHHFRHYAKKVDRKNLCTWGSESARHNLAKKTLLELKRMMVPSVKKYPPPGVKGLSYTISDASIIKAHTVKEEVYFYENKEGIIEWGKKPLDGKFLIRVDVVFFNEKEEPILLIEVVHKNPISDKKRIKLRRIGIDSVWYKIPPTSKEDIKKFLLSTRRTKWLFNKKEANEKYIQNSHWDSEGLSESDKEQRDIFSESTGCRKAAINNLIREIRSVLHSDEFREASGGIESELSEVKERTASIKRKKRDKIIRTRKENFEGIKSGIAGRRRMVATQTAGVEGEIEQLRNKLEKAFGKGISPEAIRIDQFINKTTRIYEENKANEEIIRREQKRIILQIESTEYAKLEARVSKGRNEIQRIEKQIKRVSDEIKQNENTTNSIQSVFSSGVLPQKVFDSERRRLDKAKREEQERHRITRGNLLKKINSIPG